MNKALLKSILTDQIGGLLSDSEPLITRTRSLRDTLPEKEITVVTGVRRCGKSSLLRGFIKTIPHPETVIYLNFDDPRLVEFKAEDFELLYALWLEIDSPEKCQIAIFDEIQNIPGWERWMNFFAEQKQFKVYITGSNSKLLSSELATHLTGRHRDVVLYPLSYREIANHAESDLAKKASTPGATLTSEENALLGNLFNSYFKLGGFPRVWQSKDVRLLGEYYSDILYRDIVRRHNLRQPQFIARFGASVMSDLGRKINKTKLAEALGIKEVNTINKYLALFAECYLGIEIRKFDLSIRRQLRNPSKYYAIDPVLAQRVGIHNGSKDAFYLENLVLIELFRRRSQVYYWQQSNSNEVDFVVETEDQQRHLLQVAWSIDDRDTLQRELAGFGQFEESHPKLQIKDKIIITAEEYLRIELPPGITTMSFPRWALGCF